MHLVKEGPLLHLHVAYVLVLALVGSLELWISPKTSHSRPLPFIDAVFMAVSAVTETGLGSVEMHRLSLLDQITLLLLMLLGSQVFMSAIPLFLRRLDYSKRSDPISPLSHTHGVDVEEISHTEVQEGIRRVLSMPILGSKSLYNLEKLTHDSCGKGSSMQVSHKSGGPLHSHVTLSDPTKKLETLVSFSNGYPTTEDYTQTKAMEDKALVAMRWVTTFYIVLSLMVGFLICQISILCSPHATRVLKENQVNSSLFSLFSVVSAFGNNGFILLDDNLEPMQREGLMLMCLCVLILMGNTLYAPAMRGVIWVLYKGTKGERKKVYGYLLKGTRRHYTHLFPREETIWLVGSVVFMNAFQMICILGLDWKSQALEGLGAGYKLVAALFQSINTRSGGMNIVSLSDFSSSTLFVFLAAMYIGAYPIYVAKQKMGKMPNGITTKLKDSMFFQQLCKMRAEDSFLFVAILLICIFERDSIRNDSINFSFFNIIFEVISGFGNVGLTIGYNCKLRMAITVASVCTDIPCSFSGRWSVSSKMVLILVMFLGKHRNLPYDIDWKNSTSIVYNMSPSL